MAWVRAASVAVVTTPEWTRVDGSQATCGSCHGLPPPAPHPYYAEACSDCHENVAADNVSFLRPDLHVDGVVTFERHGKTRTRVAVYPPAPAAA